jgi:hypothetical protein
VKRLTFNAAMEQFHQQFPRVSSELDLVAETDLDAIVEDMMAPDGPMPWDE